MLLPVELVGCGPQFRPVFYRVGGVRLLVVVMRVGQAFDGSRVDEEDSFRRLDYPCAHRPQEDVQVDVVDAGGSIDRYRALAKGREYFEVLAGGYRGEEPLECRRGTSVTVAQVACEECGTVYYSNLRVMNLRFVVEVTLCGLSPFVRGVFFPFRARGTIVVRAGGLLAFEGCLVNLFRWGGGVKVEDRATGVEWDDRRNFVQVFGAVGGGQGLA